MLVIAILATFTMCADAVSFNFNVLTCGSNITLTNGDVQFISSPSSMHGSYLNSVNCLWRINVAQGYRILIASNSILLEPSCGCRYDYVELFDPGSRHIVKIGRFCWDRPVQYISTADTMLVRFQSDDSVNTTGFTFSVSRVTPDPANPCNNSITGPGNILSINYPQKYPSNALCFYHIQAPEGNQVNLTFLDFNLEKEPCTSDYLNVYDGPSSASPKIGRYCWRSNPQTIISSSHDLFLQFNSDGRVEDKGFNLQIDFVTEGQDTAFTLVDNPTPESYDPDCIHVIRTLGHNLTSPNSATNGYLKRKHCITTLTAPINHRVQLHFDVIDIEKSNECRFDHVTIVHGTVKSPRSIRMCGHHDKGFNITSKGRQLQLEFESDCSIEARGYSATYEFLTGSTEGTPTHRGNEHEPNCLEHPCHSNGTCYNDGDGNKCACPTGFVPPKCSQKLDFTIRTENSTVDQSSDIILKCRVNHRHRMIVWSFNDFEVYTSSSVYKIDTNGDLTVRNAQSRNTGKYTCEVLASGTVIQHSIWLTVLQTEECGGSVLSKKRRRRRKRIASYHKILGLYSDPANITKIPWHAFLWSSRHNHTFCGGVILSKRWIVTAAHCITRHEHFDTNEVYVFAGTIDCRASDVSLMKIKSFRTYPGYGRNSNSYDHDIALIHLQESFKFTKSVLPICLPAPGKAVLLMKPGIKSVTSGCGLTENYTQSEILNYVKVPIQDATTCAKSNSIVKTSPGTAFCAGYEEQGLGDACKGDSGGGLVAREKTRWYLIGIVSYGEDCDKHGKYGFYTNVSNYYYWIKSVVDCGQKADKEPSDNFRIIGGKETHLGLLPWVAGLEDPAARNSNFDCAGVILGEYWVMTAAHCLVSQKTRNTKKSIIVAVGTIDDSSKTRTDHSQKYRIQKKKFFLLPNFTNNCGVQDLALIHLQENKGIKFNKFIQPICLPSGNAEYPGSECIISGWGKTESKSEKYAKTLRWATVNIADDNTCGRFQDTSPCKRNINLLCAGKNNTDTCSGDSGGGLICRSNGKQEVTGVISFGPKECGQALSFFTRVSSYVKWIRETIKTNAYSSEDWDF